MDQKRILNGTYTNEEQDMPSELLDPSGHAVHAPNPSVAALKPLFKLKQVVHRFEPDEKAETEPAKQL